MAPETSGFLKEKVPPKPQHSSASGSSWNSMSATERTRSFWRSPRPSSRMPWHEGWYVTGCGK